MSLLIDIAVALAAAVCIAVFELATWAVVACFAVLAFSLDALISLFFDGLSWSESGVTRKGK